MKRIVIFIIGIGFLAVFSSLSGAQMPPSPGASQEKQAAPGKQESAGARMEKMEMGSGMMQGEMPCMQMMEKMMPMMAKRDPGKMRMGGGPETGLSFFMAPFHRWMNLLMAHKESLGLSPEQVDRLDAAVTEHLKVAVRGQADIQALMIDLRHSLRSQALNLQPIEDLVKKISDQQFKLQIEGIRLYAGILNTILTEEQRTKARELIGGPFPPPWQEMPDMPSPHPREKIGSK